MNQKRHTVLLRFVHTGSGTVRRRAAPRRTVSGVNEPSESVWLVTNDL